MLRTMLVALALSAMVASCGGQERSPDLNTQDVVSLVQAYLDVKLEDSSTSTRRSCLVRLGAQSSEDSEWEVSRDEDSIWTVNLREQHVWLYYERTGVVVPAKRNSGAC